MIHWNNEDGGILLYKVYQDMENLNYFNNNEVIL